MVFLHSLFINTQKWKCSHSLLTLKLFQTCMSFFLLLNTKEDILKNVGNQTVDSSHLTPIVGKENTMEVNGYWELSGYQHSHFNILGEVGL